MTPPLEEVVLHAPDTEDPSIELDLENFMGTWHVTYSTLSLWKSKKDVTITYALKPAAVNEGALQFDDTVEYRAKSASPTSSRSTITGVDTLVLPPDSSAAAEGGDAAARPARNRFKWRGKGWLSVATSRWQVLGCSRDLSAANPNAWAVTYFEKTLFTAPGLDIYARNARGLPAELVEEIIAKAKALGGDAGTLAKTFFEVERSGVPANEAVSASGGTRIGQVDKIGVMNHMALTPS